MPCAFIIFVLHLSRTLRPCGFGGWRTSATGALAASCGGVIVFLPTMYGWRVSQREGLREGAKGRAAYLHMHAYQ